MFLGEHVLGQKQRLSKRNFPIEHFIEHQLHGLVIKRNQF